MASTCSTYPITDILGGQVQMYFATSASTIGCLRRQATSDRRADRHLLSLSVAGFAKPVAGETEKWGRVIRTASIKPEWLSAVTAGVRYASTSGLYMATPMGAAERALPEGGAARQQPL
jgi:hypothetical protein